MVSTLAAIDAVLQVRFLGDWQLAMHSLPDELSFHVTFQSISGDSVHAGATPAQLQAFWSFGCGSRPCASFGSATCWTCIKSCATKPFLVSGPLQGRLPCRDGKVRKRTGGHCTSTSAQGPLANSKNGNTNHRGDNKSNDANVYWQQP